MMQIALRLFALVASVATIGAAYGTVKVDLPGDSVRFKGSGPAAELATGKCTTCHSAAYVYTQPRLTRAQWTAEVNKMRTAYKAPLDDADVPAIVDYLMTQNGRP